MGHKKVTKKQKVPEVKSEKILPLMNTEGRFFQELVDSSNEYDKLLQKKAQVEYIIKRLSADRKKIQHGDTQLPILMTLIPKIMSYWEHDKKKVLKVFDEQLKSYNTNLLTLKGQIDSRYENYVESGIRNREFLKLRFHSGIKTKSIVAMRKYGEKDEEILFEAEFKDLVKDKDKQEELKKAHKEAVKRNVERKKKA